MIEHKKKSFRMYGSFVITIGITILILRLLNWIPTSFQKEDMRKYKSLEEAKNQLRIEKVYVPTYFPEYITWPPSEIFAQKKPFMLIMMHFIHRDSPKLTLSIYQVDVKSHFEPPKNILYVKNENVMTIKGRHAKLSLAVCQGRERCNSLTLDEGKYKMILVSDAIPEELIKMAESMLQ